jgi:hypothetical protein
VAGYNTKAGAGWLAAAAAAAAAAHVTYLGPPQQLVQRANHQLRDQAGRARVGARGVDSQQIGVVEIAHEGLCEVVSSRCQSVLPRPMLCTPCLYVLF